MREERGRDMSWRFIFTLSEEMGLVNLVGCAMMLMLWNGLFALIVWIVC